MSREQYESNWKDYYQVLGVQCDANAKTIRRAWHELSRIYHPDVAGDAEVNLARMQELNEAYEVLSDPYRKNRYDQAYQSRAKETAVPSPEVATEHSAAPPPPPPSPPTSQRPPSEDPPHSLLERRRGLAGRTKLVAAAGAIAALALIGIGVLPGLLTGGDETAARQPSSFNLAPPTPTPLPRLAPTASPSETPTTTPIPTVTPELAQVAPGPTPTRDLPNTPTLPTRNPIVVMSPEAAALGFRDFQVSGNPWMINFSGQCPEAPCLRSGPIWGAGSSALALTYLDGLPSNVRAIAFDFKAASPACCASFQIITTPDPVTVKLPNDGSWVRVEVAVPDTRPVAFKWEFLSGPSGVDGADGIWVDNIQFK